MSGNEQNHALTQAAHRLPEVVDPVVLPRVPRTALVDQPAVQLAAGTVAAVAGVTTAAYRLCEQLPLVGSMLQRGRADLMRRGETAIARSTQQVKALVLAAVMDVVRAVLAELDLTTLVREQVDVDAIVADVDIDAIVARIDLVGLANHVIEGVDLPGIIRGSTETVTAEVMTDVRTQGERADDVVAGFVDRMLKRNREPR